MTKRVLYLSGGGDEMQSRLIDADFAKRIDGKKVMYIPVALERDVLGYEAAYDWITKTFLSFEYSVDVPEIHMHLDPQRIASELSSYDALYIGGGNTFYLLDFFYKNNLIAILRKFYESEKPIYGGSAGAIIFGKDIRTVEEENDKDYLHVDGFDMCEGVSIICHYNENMDRRIYNFTETFHHEVIALPEDAGVLFENSRVSKVFGNPIIFTQSKKNYLTAE